MVKQMFFYTRTHVLVYYNLCFVTDDIVEKTILQKNIILPYKNPLSIITLILESPKPFL